MRNVGLKEVVELKEESKEHSKDRERPVKRLEPHLQVQAAAPWHNRSTAATKAITVMTRSICCHSLK
jgi:hypothetical protein